ncbi:MAG: hypothetical protein F4Y60_06425 [Boseongicola sp. SB0664_bin_43]|uniref:Uncharacterized protein n=1 Tax=Boseongicola sp. SB0664_bin_43 TaxID=2604844 RepID=A0A6B0XYA7_9RHOB|nr:hypothetical protein [Boseongicola sp. SB0664_bin_43]
MPIQLDMFEVKLGSSILIQFGLANRDVVRVLADAGENTNEECNKSHIREKIKEAFEAFKRENPKYHKNGIDIDLIIGTHYDKDHLQGLVPIIEDPRIQIGEAWLPPVANDTEIVAKEVTADVTRMLATQFSEPEGERRLHKYLRRKMEICEYIAERERAVLNVIESLHPGEVDKEVVQMHRRSLEIDAMVSEDHSKEDTVPSEEFFRRHLKSSQLYEVGLESHDLDIIERGPDSVESIIARYGAGRAASLVRDGAGKFRSVLDFRIALENGNSKLFSLAYVRRAAALDAINATYLYDVVRALKKRGIPIRSEFIQNGTPRKFVWTKREGRFISGSHSGIDEPTLTLLGPSQRLVDKYWKRLPIGMYALAAELRPIPIKGTSPSNELSYVAKLEFCGQSILVSGDTGCVDFRPDCHTDYYCDLLKELSNLSVIQVAHHGGRNAHFYRVLLRANFAKDREKSFLLLSHEVHSMHRPSGEFRTFLECIQAQSKVVEILFTSEPLREKVEDYCDLIAPVAGSSANTGFSDSSEKMGDVRLSFLSGEWRVVEHAVSVC